jgi:hypothetical protein
MCILPENDPAEHWCDKIAPIPVTAANVRRAVEAWVFCQDQHYGRAVAVEMGVCFSGVESDEEWAKIFLWLMPHLKKQVEQKNKEDRERYFARERRSGRASW